MSQFKFSVITVVKNDQYNIEKTIKSVIAQKNNIDLEYIIVDGNSSDNTLEIINRYKDKITKVISENDKGIYDAMNKGISLSSGEIIVFCNSGDVFFNNGILNVEKVFDEKKCDFVFGTIIRNYLQGKILKYNFNSSRIYYNFDFATSHSCGFFCKRNVIKFIGDYNTKYKCSADYDFYFRMINSKKFNGGFTEKNAIVGEVASGGYSSTLSFFEHLKEETKIRLDNKQNKILVVIIFFNAILKNFFKKIKF